MEGIRGFFEYRIDPAKREQYLSLIPKIKSLQTEYGLAAYEVIESIERENQFVETFRIDNLEVYSKIVEQQMKDPVYLSYREELHSYIVGGRDTMKKWLFRDVPL